MKKFTLVIFAILSFSACSSKQELAHEPMSDRGLVQYQFAYDFFQNGDMVRALAAALKAVELAPRDSDVHNILGLIYFRRGEYAKAEESFTFAAQLSPKMSEVHNNLGTLYYDQGEYEKALSSLDKALLNPMYLHPERVHNNRGLVLQAMGRFDEARAEYERAIFLRRNYYLPYQNLGKMLLSQGNATAAREALQEAARLCSECVEPRFYLGKALLDLKLQEEAVAIFEEGYQLNPRTYYGQLCGEHLEKKEK